jgi:hypothetical protein
MSFGVPIKEREKMKYRFLLLFFLLGMTAGLPAETTADRSIEIALFGGYALIQVDGSSVHQDVWNYYQLSNVRERTDIRARSENAPLAAAEVVRYLSPRFGLGAFFGFWRADIDLEADFDFHYNWTGGGGDARSASWTDSGSLVGRLLALNAFYRFGGGRFQGHISAGPVLYSLTMTLNSHFGGGVANYGETVDQHIDAIKIPIEIVDETWLALGLNLGLGFDCMFTPRLGLTGEARYFLCPEASLGWNILPGRYDGIFHENEIKGFELTAEGIRYVLDNNKLSMITINPSSFQILVGLKLKLH